MSTLATACSIARKDLRLFFRDRTGVALGFLLPLVLVGVFGFVMKLASGGDGGMSRTSLWVVDQDMSEASRRFISELRKASTLNLKPAESAAAVDEAWVRREIADGELHHALLVPAGFAAALERRELPELTMLRDPDRELDDQLVSVGLMQAAITALGPDFAEAMTTRMLERAGLPPERSRQLTHMLSHTVSGIGVMMLMFGLVAAGTQLIREREEGVLPRLLTAPADRAAILWGKYLFALLVGALQLTLLFSFGTFVFGVDVLRDPLAFLAVSGCVLLAVTAFGMLVAAAARTIKQAEGLSTLLILVMSAVGGAWFPLQLFDPPDAVKVVMACTLTDWAIRSYQAIFWAGKGLGDAELVRNLAVLLGFAVAATAAARELFLRRYVRSA